MLKIFKRRCNIIIGSDNTKSYNIKQLNCFQYVTFNIQWLLTVFINFLGEYFVHHVLYKHAIQQITFYWRYIFIVASIFRVFYQNKNIQNYKIIYFIFCLLSAIYIAIIQYSDVICEMAKSIIINTFFFVCNNCDLCEQFRSCLLS